MKTDRNHARTGLLLFFVIFGALSLWLGFANDFISFPPLVLFWPAFIVLFACEARTLKSAFAGGWLISFLGGCAALYWLYLPVTEVGGLPLLPGFACVLFVAGCLALQGGCFAILSRAFMRAPSEIPSYPASYNLSFLPPASSQEIMACLFTLSGISLCWFLLEYAFACLLGFPWLAIGGALSEWPVLVQGGDILGVWLVAALWIIPGTGLCAGIYFQNFRFFVAASPVFLLLSGYGYFMLNYSEQPEPLQKIHSLFVEGNIDQNQKWETAFQTWTLDVYLDLTEDGLEKVRREKIHPVLIIWPETALPFFFERNTVLAGRLLKRLEQFNEPLLFGAPGVVADKKGIAGGEVYNRAFLLTPPGQLAGFYDKEHLVPFGEYLPSWLGFKFLESLLQGVGVYRKGINPNPLVYEDWALGMLICYEGIFPWLARERTAAGANLLVDISNDGWFGASPAARQHLFHTIGRCVENNRWLFRSTNTGISAVIDNRGRIRQEGPQFERGWLLAEGNLLECNTVYNKIAPWLPYAVILLTIIFFTAVKTRKG